MAEKIARLAAREEDFRALGQDRDRIALWEDGLRTGGKFGEYEWWYSDVKVSDGSSLVIIFYTQPVTASVFGFHPSMSLSWTPAEGEELADSRKFPVSECSFAKDRCAVKMGESFIEGDLGTYRIRYENHRVQAQLTIRGNIPSWRPETGRIVFDEKDYFAWLPAVPEGTVEGTLTVDGVTRTITGTGYHDHNWGNKGMFWLMHHWYWGRAKVGPYQAITSYITAREKYGYEHFPIFLLAKDGVKLGDDPRYLTYTQTDAAFDPVTKKHYHKTLVYDYDDGSQHYRITYRAEDIIEYFTLADSRESVQAKSNAALRMLVKLAGLDPSYIRMTGPVTLERFENGQAAETICAPGIWELMYFGTDADV